MGAITAEIRDLAVENTGGSVYSFAIHTQSVVDVAIFDVDVTAFNGSKSSLGVLNESSSPLLSGLRATTTGDDESYGVANRSSSAPTIFGLTTESAGGSGIGVINLESSSTTIRDSSIQGEDGGVFTQSGGSATIINTQLEGGVTGADIACIDSFDETFAELDDACDVI